MEITFNQSTFLENDLNRWKFLDSLEGEAAKVGFFLRSPIPVASATVGYIIFVCFLGPLYMRNKEPYQLKSIIRFYNLLMVFSAAYLLARVYDAVDSLEDIVSCGKLFNFEDLSGTKLYNIANLIVMIRLSEYLDTIFFTLRKKQNQVTFLHVFHHAFVPIYAYWVLRTAPYRFNIFIILINSFIHVLMYFYYFLATFQQRRDPTNKQSKKDENLGPIMYIVTKLLLFKKYMTQLQILQFVVLLVYAILPLAQQNWCQVPSTYIISNVLLALMFLSLFLHFYFSVYKKTPTTKNRNKRD